jgi:hypothetical protein
MYNILAVDDYLWLQARENHFVPASSQPIPKIHYIFLSLIFQVITLQDTSLNTFISLI